jgi:RNA polymerase sigma factor (sigma-70 family)
MIPEERRGDFSWQTEVTRFEQAQGGSTESLNELMQQHERLVHWVVHRQWLLSLPYEEAVQLGYDPARGVRFATYACKAIMKYVWKAVKCERRRKEREVPLGILVLYWYEPGPDPVRLRDWEEVRQSLLELVNRLPAMKAEVMRRRYGLAGRERQTQAEIGKRMGVSHQRVGQIETEALMWLRQPAHSQELRSLLARHDQQQYELADQLAQAWLRRRGGRHERRKTHP